MSLPRLKTLYYVSVGAALIIVGLAPNIYIQIVIGSLAALHLINLISMTSDATRKDAINEMRDITTTLSQEQVIVPVAPGSIEVEASNPSTPDDSSSASG